MKRIESLQNPKIKRLRRILDGKNREFWIIEGNKLLKEAVESNIEITEIFVTEKSWQTNSRRLQSFEKAGTELIVIPSSMLKKLSAVETPPGLLATVKRVSPLEWKQVPDGFAALLYSVRDPGNFGTIIRTAEAAGCEFLAYTSDCADPYAPKVIRASMGSIFRVPLFEVANAASFLIEAKVNGVHIYSLVPLSGEALFSKKPVVPAMLVIGSESHGLPEDMPAESQISIPMSGKVESLNVAIAAGICFYWFAQSLSRSI